MATELRYVIANRHHLFILHCMEQGITLETYRKPSHQKNKNLRIPNATRTYVACQDHHENLHLIYFDQSNQLMHASINLSNLIHADSIPISTQLIDSSLHKLPLELHLQCCHNSLQLLLLYEHKVIHYQLAGVYWSSPTILEQSAVYMSLQMYKNAEQVVAYIWIKQYPSLIIHQWIYEHAKARWKLIKQFTLASEWQKNETLFVSSSFQADLNHQLQLLRFPKGKLVLEQYELQDNYPSGMLNPYQKSMLLTPICTVQTAWCEQDEEALHLTWLADNQLYRSSYHLNREAWGSLQVVDAPYPVQWIILSSDHALPCNYSQWMTTTGDWLQLNEQLGWIFDIDDVRRDFQHSITFAASSISSLERLLPIKQQMIHDIHQLEETLGLVNDYIQNKQQRLEVLGEERDTRQALIDFMTRAYTQQLADHVLTSASMQQPTTVSQDQSMKHKVASLLQRMTKFR